MAARFVIFFFYFFLSQSSVAKENTSNLIESNLKAKIVILDKVTSKKTKHILPINKVRKIYDLNILIKRCILDKSNNSGVLYAYLQIKNNKIKNKNSVYIFNGWMINNYRSINPFEHSNYDLWIESCY